MNEKVIKAITLGLAAFMALQSPMAVLAAEGEGNPAADPGNTPNPTSQENTTPVDIEGGVADAAQVAANDAAVAIGDSQVLTADPGNTNPTPAPASEPGNTDPASAPAGTPASAPAGSEGSGDGSEAAATPEPVAESVLDVIKAGAAAVAEANKEGTTAKAPSNEAEVEQKASEFKTTVEGAGNVPGTVKSADDAVEKNIKQELITAENAVVASNSAAQDYVDNFVAASNAANNADAEVSGALQKADEYIKTINNASSITEANKAKDDLDKLVKDVTADLALQQQAFDEFSGKLDTARTELLDAEDRFNKAIGGATADVTAAKVALKESQEKVNALEEQVNAAVNDIQAQNAAALEIMAKMDALKGNGWDDKNGWDPKKWESQRELFKAILMYNPCILDSNAIDPQDIQDIKIEDFNAKEKTVTAEGGKYHYFKVTYKVNGEEQVKYFNYDREDKKENKDGKNGTGKNIIIYEKTQEEIDAVEYLKKYLADAKKANGGKAVTYDINKHTVFSYTVQDENGKDVTKYAVKEELVAVTGTNGEVSYYVKNGDGTEIVSVAATPVPTDDELKALQVGGESKTSTEIVEGSEKTSYYLNEEGQLVKEVTGDYVTTTYTRLNTGNKDDFQANKYSDTLDGEQKDAIIAAFKSGLEGINSDGQQVRLEFAEIVDTEGTFYQLTGSYVPLFKIDIKEGDNIIREFVDDNDGHGIFDGGWISDRASEKEKNAITTFLKRLEDAGCKIILDDCSLESQIDAGWNGNHGKEPVWVWGHIEYTKNDIAPISVIGAESNTKNGAKSNLEAAIKDSLKSIGNDNVTVETVTQMHCFILEWADYGNRTLAGSKKGYTDPKITAGEDGYTKYSYCINYVQAVVDATKEGAVLSETTYENAAQALEVIQNANSKFANPNGGGVYLDVANDPELNKLVEDARSLLNQYTEYQTQIGQAQTAIGNARKKVDALEGAINDLGTVATVGEKTIVTSSVGRLTLGAALTKNGVDQNDWAKYLGLNTETKPAVSDDGIIVSDLGEKTEIPFEELLGMPVGDTDLTFGSLLELPVRDALDILDGLLAKEKEKIETASNKLEELQEKQLKAGEDLAKTIDRLTPKPSDDDGNPGTEGQPGDPGTGGDNGSSSGTPGAPAAGGRTANAGGGADDGAGNGGNRTVLGARNGGRGGRNAGAGDGELTTIGDGKTALAGSIKDAKANKADSETQKYDKANIEDQDTPLADFEVEGVEKGSWQWWILALLAGAVTLEEFIRRKRNNAAQASASAESDSKTTD